MLVQKFVTSQVDIRQQIGTGYLSGIPKNQLYQKQHVYKHIPIPSLFHQPFSINPFPSTLSRKLFPITLSHQPYLAWVCPYQRQQENIVQTDFCSRWGSDALGVRECHESPGILLSKKGQESRRHGPVHVSSYRFLSTR